MNYYWVIFNQGTRHSLVADVVDLCGVDPAELLNGRPLSDWPAQASLRVGPDGQNGSPDDVLQTGAPFPVFSERLKTTIEDAGVADIQYLPIKCVQEGEPGNVQQFFVANLLERGPALDLSHSDIRRYPEDYFVASRRGAIASVRRPTLRATSLARPHHLFRTDEFPRYVFASERFRDLFRLGRFTGIHFEPADVCADH